MTVTQVHDAVDVAEGALIAGKYRVIRPLGRGGMGLVVEAEHARIGERVAIKFLAPEQLANPDARTRFEREARATSRLRSEHVARVRDVGELESGQPFLVMELLVGTDLGQLATTTSLAPIAVVDLALQACEALAEAHAQGIVHRDLKPANLFVVEDADGRRTLKLLDFGVATGAVDDVQLTATGVVVGTPAYMCPEQMRSSRDAEPHWDLWSLAAVLYELTEGVPPFEGDSYAELAVSVLTGAPRPMTRTPDGLRPVLLRCFDKDPGRRFAEARELAAALAPFGTPAQAARSRARIASIAGEGPPSDARPPAAFDPTSPTLSASTGAAGRARGGRRLGVVLAGLAGAIGLAGALLLARRWGGAAGPGAAPAPDPIVATPAVAGPVRPPSARPRPTVAPDAGAATAAGPVEPAITVAPGSAPADARLSDEELMKGRN